MSSSITLRITGIKGICHKTALRGIIFLETSVKENWKTYLLHLLTELFLINVAAPSCNARLHIVSHIVYGICHNILEIRTVGNVHINEEFRQPVIVKFQPGLHLRSISLKEIPVQSQLLCGIPGTQLLRAVLVYTVEGGKILVAVHIEDRNTEETHIIQHINVLLPDNHIP